MTVEVEVRSFISKEQHDQLLKYFRKHGKYISKDFQETYYFDYGDLRTQKNNFYGKIWLKSGKMHDSKREELEVRFKKEDFPLMNDILHSLGYRIRVKWLRSRQTFKWHGVNVMIDSTKGYGYILELEKMSSLKGQDNALEILKKRLESLGIKQTPRKIFEERLTNYKLNWKKLISSKLAQP